MVKLILAGVLILIAIWLNETRKIYNRMGKDQKFSDDIKPSNSRALHYISGHKNFANALVSLCLLLLVTIALTLLFYELGLWSAAIIYLVFVWLFALSLHTKQLPGATKLAYLLAPPIRNGIETLKPHVNKTKFISKRIIQDQKDTGIYTPKDLMDLLKKQKSSQGNSISEKQLENIIKRLEFEDKKVGDLMDKFDDLRVVGASEQIGPVLISELHELGRKYFLVEEEFNNEITGVLSLDKLVGLKHTGDVGSVMDNKLFFLRKDSELNKAIDAYLQTNQNKFVVVDSHQTIVGLLYIDDVIRNLANIDELDEFNMYDSQEAVAKGDQWNKEENSED